MLEAVDLVKKFGNVNALNGFSIQVEAGEIVGLVGHNGAGKTTFAQIVAGLRRPDAGLVRLAGRSPRRARRLVGLAAQELALYPDVTVRETLRLFGGLAGLRRAALRAAIDDVAASLRIEEFMDRHVGLLSGGQQRRVHAAAAMLHRPAVLLLDEPTAGVDPQTRQALLHTVRARADEGAAVVYTTHYLPELVELRATIAVAARGRVIARGTASELLRDLPGEVRLTVAGGELRVPTTSPADTLVELLRTVDGPVLDVDLRRPSLDDLYRAVSHAG